MNIIKGKFYRTRDGRKAEIYSTDNPGRCCIHGRVLEKTGNAVHDWGSDGRYALNCISDADLISEWVDKPEVDWSALAKQTKWVAMDEDGMWFAYDVMPDQRVVLWRSSDGDYYKIHPDYAPKNYTGDWKDSLVERPEKV